jgi:NAD(P)-dependent dehydrogenase (short-subunit alcohol dehydrogenase family)
MSKEGGNTMNIRDLFGYDGKTVVVSGAYSGMGYAAVKLLVELGADVYAVRRRNGRHQKMDLPVKRVLDADFGVKEDLDSLVEQMPENIFALFLCHGIALKHDASNALEVQKVNFLGHKYLLEKTLHKVSDNGSVNIISSTGGFGWEANYDNCRAVLKTESYEDTIAWYEAHPDVIKQGYVFSKQCLCAYVRTMVHTPEYIGRRIRLNAINPGNTLTGLTDEFNRYSSASGDADEGKAKIESIFLKSWNGRWASSEEMGYPLVAIGGDLFSYMNGQLIYLDYGMSSVWQMNALNQSAYKAWNETD